MRGLWIAIAVLLLSGCTGNPQEPTLVEVGTSQTQTSGPVDEPMPVQPKSVSGNPVAVNPEPVKAQGEAHLVSAQLLTSYVNASDKVLIQVEADPGAQWSLRGNGENLYEGTGGGTFQVELPSGYYQPLALRTQSGSSLNLGNLTVRGTLPAFASERSPELHVGPGSAMDPGCTTNFLFTVDNLRYFVGAAGHCFANTANAALDGDLCDTDSEYRPIGWEVEIQGAEKPGKLAYGSYYQLRQNVNVSKVWQDHPDECFYNDFALIELDPADFDNMHPAVPLHGGPTALGPIPDPASRAATYAYGATYLRLNTPNQDTPMGPNEADAFQGVHESYADGTGDWVVNTRIAPIQVFGDSGMPFLGPNGEAVGNLHGQGVAFGPGAAVYTNMPMAVEYAQGAFDGRLELVTWTDFHPQLPIP